jgi:hypothetical protein
MNVEQETKKKTDDLKRLQEIRMQYKAQSDYLSDRKSRLEDMMSRTSSKSWSPSKKAKMAKRLQSTTKELVNVNDALMQIDHRLRHVSSN